MSLYMLPLGGISFIKQHYPGWGALLEKVSERKLTAKDAKKILSLSYRRLNDWEHRGKLKSIFGREMKRKTEGWRKFSVLDLLCLGVLKEVKKHGISIKSLQRFMGDIFLTGGYVYEALPSLVYGVDVFLCTNLDDWMDTFFMGPKDQYVPLPVKDLKQSHIAVIFPLNKIVDDIFEELQLEDFEAIKKPEGGYRFIVNQVPLALEDLPRQE